MASDEDMVNLMTAFRAAIGHISDELTRLATVVRETGHTYTADEVADMLTQFAANIEITADETIAKRDS
jgi:hypothetical protein